VRKASDLFLKEKSPIPFLEGRIFLSAKSSPRCYEIWRTAPAERKSIMVSICHDSPPISFPSCYSHAISELLNLATSPLYQGRSIDSQLISDGLTIAD
jgi:ribosomal protein S18 acetylase RimI-like enzyme